MTSGYYCAIFPFCGGGKKKKKYDKKTKAFYDWATTGIPVKMAKLSGVNETVPASETGRKYPKLMESVEIGRDCSKSNGGV